LPSFTVETDEDGEVENPDYIHENIIESNHMAYYEVASEDLLKTWFDKMLLTPKGVIAALLRILGRGQCLREKYIEIQY
jgi:hypothetical protein